MLNFRKLRQDFPPVILKKGKEIYDKKSGITAKLLQLDTHSLKVHSRIQGKFNNHYECELEINREESTATDSNCDCPYNYDCQHLAALVYFLEEHLDEIVVQFAKEGPVETVAKLDEEEKKQLKETFQIAATKEVVRQDKKHQKELLHEYRTASALLSDCPFFLPEEPVTEDKAELAVIFSQGLSPLTGNHASVIEIQIALRLPFRSKPLHIPQLREFLDAIRNQEAVVINGKRYYFTSKSFDDDSQEILSMMINHTRFPEAQTGERSLRTGLVEGEAFGALLAHAHELGGKQLKGAAASEGTGRTLTIPCLYKDTLENPLCFSPSNTSLRFTLEYTEKPTAKIFLKPMIILNQESIRPEKSILFECPKPGLIFENTYYRFQPQIKRTHLRYLSSIGNMTIPEPLFGTFVENALPELQRFAEVSNKELIQRFVTLPYVEDVKARCKVNYLNGELEASLYFRYKDAEIPASETELDYHHISTFVTDMGILARDLAEEREMLDNLFQDFVLEPKTGAFTAKTEKKIVEFMTEVIPRFQNRVSFECPDNLLDQFLYDETHFKLTLKESPTIETYQVDLEVQGNLQGITLDLLWECIATKKAFIELDANVQKAKSESKSESKLGATKSKSTTKHHRILVLDLEKLAPVVQIFDEIGIQKLDNHQELRPLWSLASINAAQFEGLPIAFKISDKLLEVQQQMLGLREITPSPIPACIKADLRNYQTTGIHWIERLRLMHLNGILADDMGLGKTLQAIVAITQYCASKSPLPNMIVCPTSLLYNWQAEFIKFNKNLKVLVIDGVPNARKKLFKEIPNYDVIVTSYSLLQKDIESYGETNFGYAVLDEAQHIKNRGTLNAKSVRLLRSKHRLILTGTPIENSLEELWSLFDFLMPGLLSSYDRFVEKYIRNTGLNHEKNLNGLRQKISPFILRRMKKDVLSDLPPVSEIVYHCPLSPLQQQLYKSYAKSAREELSKLVQKEGFDKVQIHVLATLTRLKQICCHPAIFAKEVAEENDSGKYDLLVELLQSLIAGKHKTVIFSQYTRMLHIMRDDLQKMGIRFSYLDGTSKNRLGIVNEFNEDPGIPVFLVSLKAGGSGLNLTGADTVIHYDIWWNPAVENQATDRVHRLGQQQAVSSYKLITVGTIEEKIVELQNRKRGLVTKVISSDDEALAKLTWEEVLGLLQT